MAEFLELWKAQTTTRAKACLESLLPSALVTKRGTLTLRLMWADVFEQLLETWQHYSADQMMAARNSGLAECEAAVEVAAQLGDRACEVFYLELLARGIAETGSNRAALEKYESALRAYRAIWRTASRGVYRPYLATTLNNIGTVLSDLTEKRAAHEKYEPAT